MSLHDDVKRLARDIREFGSHTFRRMQAIEQRLDALEDLNDQVFQEEGGLAKASRDGQPWTQFEKDLLSGKLDKIVSDLSIEFSRYPNAIWWAMYRYSQIKKK